MKKTNKVLILIFILILILAFVLNKVKNLYKVEYSQIIKKYSEEFNIEESLIYSIIKNESHFNKEAKSSKNAIGLMQVLETTKSDIEIEDLDLFNEEDNILVGTKYLSLLNAKYENIELAIAAYNAGPR